MIFLIASLHVIIILQILSLGKQSQIKQYLMHRKFIKEFRNFKK